MSPCALVLPLHNVSTDVWRDVGLCPSFIGLQGDQALFTQRGDLSPAARRLGGLGGIDGSCRGGSGGRGAEVDE